MTIITDEARSLEEIRRAGLEALRRELGPRGMVLFLRQFIEPSGDYTAERAELVGHLTVDEIFYAIEKRRAEAERNQSS